MTDTYFPKTLPAATAEIVSDLQSKNPQFLSSFYLSGGTALSLQIGHRESEDLDFFSEKPFDPLSLEKDISQLGKLTDVEISKGTLNAFVKGVKLQFLEYPYPLLKPFKSWKSIQLSSVIDIACTKLQTISMRGSKKDFIDLYFLLNDFSLGELFTAIEKKYQNVEYSKTHILKSLVFFEDAEAQPMPRMHSDISWNEVKEKMIEVIKSTDI